MRTTRTAPNRSGRLARSATLIVATFAASAAPCLGWGFLGHRTAARLAEARLTPATKAAVASILGPGETLAVASTWPDEHRRDIPESAPWHYVNVPITQTKYDAKFCQAGGCVVSKIADYRAKLRDPMTSLEGKREALRFVAHLVQDLHQPVHVGDRSDRGGNDLQLQFFGQGSNMHRIWDSGLLEHVERDDAKTLERLSKQLTPEYARAIPVGTVETWADESLAAAREAYNDPVTGQPFRTGARVSEAYQAKSIPVAERRLIESSVRLARILNEIFDPTTPDPTLDNTRPSK